MNCKICNRKFNSTFYLEKHYEYHDDTCIPFLDNIDYNKFNYNYVHIPKCAGSSIKKKLRMFNECVEIKNTNQLSKKHNIVCFGHSYFRHFQFPEKVISFTRNPYTRCLSLFNYFGLNEIYDFEEYIDKIYKNTDISEYIKNSNYINKRKQFKLLVTRSGRTNVTYAWKSQSTWIPKDNLFFIGKIETLEDDLKKLAKKININYKLIDKKWNVTETKKKKENYIISENTKQQIYELYKEDFIRFNYKK